MSENIELKLSSSCKLKKHDVCKTKKEKCNCICHDYNFFYNSKYSDSVLEISKDVKNKGGISTKLKGFKKI